MRGKAILVGVTLGLVARWARRRSRTMSSVADSRFNADDSPGDRIAAHHADLSLEALTELYGDAREAKVVHWRIEELTRAGFDDLRAATIAAVGADWRRAIELVRSGCPHALATDIVL